MKIHELEDDDIRDLYEEYGYPSERAEFVVEHRDEYDTQVTASIELRLEFPGENPKEPSSAA
jgi:hypothetical protein